MRIYIDEAGGFIPRLDRQHSFSLVLALIVPSSIEAEVFYDFLRLRDSWPEQQIEVKGRRLDEAQAAQVIDMLCRHDVLAAFYAVDMATHDDNVVNVFKNHQADSVTVHLTPEHHPTITRELHELSAAIGRMPNQLFVQGFVTTRLIFEVTQQSTLYYAQRLPAELGDISWFIDRKNRTITEMEQTWAALILPASESYYARTPLSRLRGADYSHYQARYGIDFAKIDEKLREHVEWIRSAYGVKGLPDKIVDSKKLLTEQRQFLDSRDSLGLQLADMLASILRRALNGHLQYQGWKDFGRLLVRKTGSSFIQLGRPGDGTSKVLRGRAENVSRALSHRAKSMWAEEEQSGIRTH